MSGRRSRVRTMVRVAAWVVLALVLLVVGIVAVLGGTAPGLRWVLARAAPPGLTVGHAEGRLLDDVRLEELALTGNGLVVTARSARVRWSPRALLRLTIDVEEILLEDVSIELAEASAERPPSTTAFHSPVRVIVRGLRLDGLRVTIAAGDSLHLGSGSLRGTLEGRSMGVDALELRDLVVADTRLDLQATGSADVPGPPGTATAAVDLRIDWTARLADGSDAAGTLRLSGDEALLDVQGELTRPTPARLVGEVRDARLATTAWAATVTIPEVDLTDVLPDAPPVRLRGTVAGSGSREGGAVRFDLAGAHPETGPGTLTGVASYAGRMVGVDGARLDLAAGPAATASGWLELGDAPRGSAAVRWTRLGWPLDTPATRLPRGSLVAEGSLREFTVRARGRVEGDALPPGDWSVQGRGGLAERTLRVAVRLEGGADRFNGLIADADLRYGLDDGEVRLGSFDLRVPATGGRLTGSGRALTRAAALDADGAFSWRGLAWPLDSLRTVVSESGRIQLAARDTAFTFDGAFHLAGTDMPPGQWRVRGRGSPRQIVVDSLVGRVLGGTVRGAGVVRTGARTDWRAALRAEGLDPSELAPEWPGDVDLAAELRGFSAGSDFGVTVPSLRIGGTLRGRPVEGAVRGSGDAGGADLDSLFLRSGTATITGRGAFRDSVRGTFSISAERLDDLYPGLEGSASVRLRLDGRRTAPLLVLEAEARELGFDETRVGALEADVVFDGGFGEESRATVLATGVRSGGQVVDSVFISARGTDRDHSLRINATATDAELAADIRGGWADSAWTGAVEALDLRSPELGAWSLGDPARIRASAEAARIEPFCWTGAGRFCADAEWSAIAGTAWRATGEQVPLAFFGAALPPGLEMTGALDLTTTGAAVPGEEVPRGELRATAAGALRLDRPTGEVITQPFDSLVVTGRSDREGLIGDFAVRLPERGWVSGFMAAVGPGPLSDRPLQGRLDAELRDDGEIARQVEEVSSSAGVLRAALELAGTASLPTLRGRVVIDSVSGAVEALGLRVPDARLEAISDDGRVWRIDGRIAGDTGTITLAGTADLPSADAAWNADLEIRGNGFQALRTDVAQLSLSPRITVAARPDGIRADGEIRIPDARLAIRQVELAVNPSPDVVIVNGGTEAPATGALALPVHANIRVVLGNDIHVDAQGLQARLTGSVLVNAAPDRPPLGTGELHVLDGRYRIYRQTFAIERGRLIYAGTPLSDPALDLRVTRRANDVLAGMTIEGTVSRPRVELFSDPTLTDDEVLAYLLLGRPLNRATRAEGEQVRNMAESAGVAGGNLLLARLNALFSLGEARIERERSGGTRQTSLVLGRQVLPRVHVGYAIPIRGSQNVLRIRYVIGRGFSLQTESGEEVGADLLYVLER